MNKKDVLKLNQELDDRLDGRSFRFLTQSQYNSLSDEEKNNEKIAYIITDAPSSITFLDVADDEVFSVIEPVKPTITYGNVVVSKRSITMSEGTTSNDAFSVVLDKAPTNEQTVSIVSDNADVTVNPTTLTFTSANYDTPQSVSISAAEDEDYDDDSATITLSTPNADGVTILVSVIDNDEEPALDRIEAVYTQGETVIYPSTLLDNLKSNLVVTAYYTNSTNGVVNNYTLSGTLTVGTSTITVTYQDKTATFDVTVSEVPVADGFVVTTAETNENGTYLVSDWEYVGVNDTTQTLFSADATSTNYVAYQLRGTLSATLNLTELNKLLVVNNCVAVDDPSNFNSTFMNEDKNPDESYFLRNNANLYVKVLKSGLEGTTFPEYALQKFGKFKVRLSESIIEYTLDPNNISGYTASDLSDIPDSKLYDISFSTPASDLGGYYGFTSFGYRYSSTPLYTTAKDYCARVRNDTMQITLPNSANINNLDELKAFFTRNVFKIWVNK